MFLTNGWYVAGWSEGLAPGAMLSRTLLGKPVVLFRTADGAAHALADICPHRFAPLSFGKFDGERIACSYHGLEFDRTGACVHNPHGQERIPAGARARRYPVVEKHTLVWIWMGEAQADPATIPDYSFLDDNETYPTARRDCIRIEANYRLIIDNLLDLSHVSFLHDGILGNADTIKAEILVHEQDPYLLVTRNMRYVTPSAMQNLLFRRDGARVDAWSEMRWSAPANLLNNAGACPVGGARTEGAGLLGAHLLTPETETSTFYHFCAARQGVRTPGFDAPEVRESMGNLRRMAFEEQDGRMLAAQQRLMQIAPQETSQPILLETDVGIVRCGRILEALIAAEQRVVRAAE